MKNHTRIQACAGYTLFELALVVTIVALIIGGVLGAQTMIRNAELQSVIEDTNAYIKAVQMFKDKYHELPGDMPNATDFWGLDASCPNTAANITPKIATCNGNGDGFIGNSTSSPFDRWTLEAQSFESYRAWQQLADAGFIKGQYTGAPSSRAIYRGADPGMNVPASKITGNGFSLLYVSPTTGAAALFTASYRHILIYGTPENFNFTVHTYNTGLTTVDAMNIDQKMDDGMPGTGEVMSFPTGTLTNCATSNTPSTATYKTTYTTGPACSLIFITGF